MDALQLTSEERAAAERTAAKLERQAQQWPRLRWLILGQTILLAALAAYFLSDFWTGISSDAAVSSQVAEGPPPSLEMPVQLWVNAEMNRQRELLRTQRQMDRLAMQEGVIGVVLALMALTLAIVLWQRWDEAPKKSAWAKLLRQLLAQN